MPSKQTSKEIYSILSMYIYVLFNVSLNNFVWEGHSISIMPLIALFYTPSDFDLNLMDIEAFSYTHLIKLEYIESNIHSYSENQ